MMNPMVTLAALGFGERASTSGIVTLQGMLTIFLVLSILWAAIEIMHRVLYKDKKPAKKEQKAEHQKVSVTVAAPAPVVTEAPAPVAASDDGAIIAAITAAILAMRTDSGESGTFRVVSFKRVNRK